MDPLIYYLQNHWADFIEISIGIGLYKAKTAVVYTHDSM